MTQHEDAVGGATNDEPVIAAEPTIEDRFAALTDEEPQAEEQPQAGEDAPELEADDIDEGDIPPIQAPASWPDEDKAIFAELPRAAQERVAAREAEREKFIQSKSREAKQAQDRANVEAANAIKRMNETNAQAIVALLPEIPEKPSAHLMVTDPQAYAEAVDYHDWAVGQHHAAREYLQTLQAQNQQLDAASANTQMQESIELLAQEFPEFLDPAKATELRSSLTSTGLALGYSQEALNSVDGHDVLALRKANEWKSKADKYDALMAKRMENVREGKNPPRITRPGAAQPRGAAANERYMQDRQAMRSGDKDATTRVFSKFI